MVQANMQVAMAVGALQIETLATATAINLRHGLQLTQMVMWTHGRMQNARIKKGLVAVAPGLPSLLLLSIFAPNFTLAILW